MVGLPRSWLPHRFLPRQDDRQPVEICDDALVPGFIEGKQPSLVRQQLPDGDLILTLLGKLRPVLRDTLIVIKQAPRIGKRHSQTGQSLCCGEHNHHRIFFPGCASSLVPYATPYINDFFTTVVDATGGSDLIAASKVLDERFPYRLKPLLHMTRYCDVCLLHLHAPNYYRQKFPKYSLLTQES